MKKIATFVMIIVVMAIMTIPALASQPDYPVKAHKQYDTDHKFIEWEKRLSERGTAHWYKGHNKKLINWYIKSLDNHQHVIARHFPNKSEVYALHTDRIDFIEFGRLFESRTDNEIETVKQDFEKDHVDAALKFIFPVEENETEGFEECKEELRNEIEEKNIPVYWNIKPMKWDPRFYVIEVAIGKYVIQQGDTLSKIAEQFDTSVEEILRQNYNIDDQNLIYAGNYLCIW